MKRGNIGLIAIIFIFLFSLYSYGQGVFLNPGGIYDESMDFYHQGRCEEAILGFSKIIQSAPESKLVSYSQYMMGLCFLKMGKEEEAIRQFELYLKTYPDGDRKTEAERGIQIAREQLKQKSPVLPPISKTVEKKSLPEEKKTKRRICAQVTYLEAKTLGEVENRVKELKKAGVNTIIFRVFQSKGNPFYPFVTTKHKEGVYFKTEHAPVVEDVLGKIAEIVHRNGLDLFAWMTTRYANYGLEGRLEYRCKSYNFETKKIEMARGFNLFHPDVLKRLEGIFRDLGRYPIEGILFQDDLILKHHEDFSMEANMAFQKEFGYTPHPDLFYIEPYAWGSGKYYVKAYTDRFESWARWKNRWLMNVAKRLMESARESNPKLQFAINLYFEAVLNDLNGVAWFSQSLMEAMKKDFDYYAIMAYHRQAMKDKRIGLKEAIGLMAETTQKAVGAVGDPSKVLMKIWIHDWKSNEAVTDELAPREEIEEILLAILKQGEVSLAFVPYFEQFPVHSFKGKWISPHKITE